jgi:hypothetical protein
MSAPHIIVTADDFGLDVDANAAIIDVLTSGVVSHASVITNMPAFDEACELARSRAVIDRVGLHLNLTQGTPLTDAMRRARAFCVDGEFAPPSRWKGLVPLTTSARRVLADEVRAQIAKARSRGLLLTHLDSHNEIHIEPNVAATVAAVAAEAGIRRLRPARNCGERRGSLRLVLHGRYNAWLKRRGLMQVRYFGTIDDLLWLARQRQSTSTMSAEVMTHPAPGPQGIVGDGSAEPLAERVRELHARFNRSPA